MRRFLKRKIKQLSCTHENQYLKVLDAFAMYEKTAIYCKDCEKKIAITLKPVASKKRT